MKNSGLLLVALALAVASSKWPAIVAAYPQLGGAQATQPAADVEGRFAAVALRGADRVRESSIIQTTEDLVRCVELAFMVEFDGNPPAKLGELQNELQQAVGWEANSKPRPLTDTDRKAAEQTLLKYAGASSV